MFHPGEFGPKYRCPIVNSSPCPNQHKYKFGTQLTHDLSRVAVLVTQRQDLNGRQARRSSRRAADQV